MTIVEPEVLTCSIRIDKEISCNGGIDGKITVTPTGGTGIKMYGKDNGTTYQVSNVFDNLSAGSYTIKVKDANGCTSTCSKTLNNPPALSCSTEVTNLGCNGGNNGSITITPSGGTGNKMYKLDNGAYQPGNTFTGLSGGTYTKTVKDANI